MALDVKIISSWRNHCRLCLLDDGIMAPLFDGEGLNRQIGHKIEACLQLKSYDGDPLPTKICHKCLYKIDQAYEFRTMALNSYERIKSHLLPLKHVPNVEEYLLKAGHLQMSDQDLPSNLPSSTRSEAKIRVKSETELMGDDQWPPNLESPFSSTPKPSSSMEATKFENPASTSTHQDLKRKRFYNSADSTSFEGPEKNMKKAKTKHPPLAGPASRKRQVQSSQWNCVFCLSSFSSKASLNVHLEKCLKCGFCQKDFSSFQEKVIHEAVHISIPLDCDVKHLRWKCNSCPARFASSVMLSTHTKDNHNFFVKSETDCKAESESKVFLDEDEDGASTTTFSCITCHELFRSNRMLLDHEKIIHGRFRCSSCSEVFDSQKALSSHKRCHVVTQASIKKYFEKNGNLTSPVTKKPLSCNICYEAFDEEDSFVLHLYHHATEEQSDDESVAPKKSRKGQTGKKKRSTSTSTVVNSSENTSEQFSVKCERCHVVCRSREYYKIHLATHVSKAKTSFPCSGCNQDFRNVEALNRHTCCGKQLDDLNKCCLDCGQGLIDGDGHICDNKCPECDKVFKSARGQRLHFAHKHRRKVPTENGFDAVELDEEDVHNRSDRDSVENQNINVKSQIKVENEPSPAKRTDETSENGLSDSDDCHCNDSNSSRSLQGDSPVERLPPDGASIVEPVPCQFNSTSNDFEQSKISPNLETNQNDV
ncbi:zinc finger protein 197-like [Thrips palmi]|uniref:Zinc finger protein 197-like n=1 Tax=Thrips palmi TaxID=161013 RepID=A0A6P8ZY56_THRPL|nr:zinc finger protein 197-like [Thrips palmi]